MIILVYGADTFRSSRRIKELMEEHKKRHKSGLNLRYLDAKNSFVDDLKNEMFGLAMFQEKKLIIIEGVFANAKFKEDFLKQGDIFSNSENILMLYEKSDIAAKDKLLNYLKDKKAKIEQFSELSGVKLRAWADKEISSLNGKISPAALEKMVEFVGSDLWRMRNEIIKLVNFNGNGKNEITEKDVEEMVCPEWEVNIFDAIDAIAIKDKKRAINLFKKQIDAGAEIPYLIAMVAWQIKNIIIAKADGGGASGIRPFVLRKAMYQAKNFSLESLKAIYQKIIDLDLSLKVGKITPETALDLLILEI
ncbi:MAG: DNA polymerase III subunit delta [Candidatus Pacebacteria bacterium]|nr:DNA polymerase III subunit delta [Candidatus Paceibacterota bacterium]